MSRKRILFLLTLAALSQFCPAQIQNRLKVKDEIHVRYAYGRMQPYSLDNIRLSDSIYNLGVADNDNKLKCLALSLELPVRYYTKEFERMDSIAAEMKRLGGGKKQKELNEFYYSAIFDYCQFLIETDRATQAMLQARDIQRQAQERGSTLGKMYACKTIGLFQIYRSNSILALDYFRKAIEYCKQSKNEQELPNLYILMAQELIKLNRIPEAKEYTRLAEEYQDFFPSIRIRTALSRAYIYKAEKQNDDFIVEYQNITNDPLYKTQVELDRRNHLEITYLRIIGEYRKALDLAETIEMSKTRLELKYQIFEEIDDYNNAYIQLQDLLNEKDSIYLAVQNEDMAILDAEMNNAKLRADADKLKAQNQMTVVISFLVMLIIAFLAIILSAFNLEQNLNGMKKQNREFHIAREAYQRALDTKELENQMKIKIIQNRPKNR